MNAQDVKEAADAGRRPDEAKRRNEPSAAELGDPVNAAAEQLFNAQDYAAGSGPGNE